MLMQQQGVGAMMAVCVCTYRRTICILFDINSEAAHINIANLTYHNESVLMHF